MKLNYLNLRPEGTPQRIYTYYCLLTGGNDDSIIKRKVCPKELFPDEKNRDDFFSRIKAQCDIFKHVIENSSTILQNQDTFRKEMRKYIFNDKNVEGEFTRQYLSGKMGICSVREMRSGGAVEGEAKLMQEENLLCWRFWMQYVGLCVLQDSKNADIVIYNFSKCIEDFIWDKYPNGVNMSLYDFLNNLFEYCEVLKDTLEDKQMKDSLSLSMKILQMSGKIDLKFLGDSTKAIYMSSINSISVAEKYSQIIINS